MPGDPQSWKGPRSTITLDARVRGGAGNYAFEVR